MSGVWKNLKRVVAPVAVLMGGLLLASCATEPPENPAWFEDDRTGETFATKPLGTNGQLDYCGGGVNNCVQGEGDCDGPYHCAAGLKCGADNGPQFGMWPSIDVCVPPSCTNGIQDPGELGVDCNDVSDCGACVTCPIFPNGHRAHCDALCPCSEGEGDCDNDGQCAGSLVCESNIGARFGFNGGIDVCVVEPCTNGVLDAGEDQIDCGGVCGPCPTCPANGGPNTCDPWECKCDAGEGDCDSNNQCNGNLVCPSTPNGGQFPGIYEAFNVCVPQHCNNGSYDPGMGEVEIDCGGPCGNICSVLPQPGVVDLVISEILADPPAGLPGDANGDGTRSATQDEFVELVNIAGYDVDLSGVTISDGVGVRHTFPGGTTLLDGQAIVVFGGGTPTGSFGGSEVQTASSGTLALNNSGDTVFVDNASAARVVAYTYGAYANQDESVVRSPEPASPRSVGGSMVRHSQASGAVGVYSPGTKVDGATSSW